MPDITLTPPTVTPQEAPDASGTGYGKRQRLKLHIDGGGSVASFRASGAGTFSDQGLPTKPVGQHLVQVRDTGGAVLAAQTYLVEKAAQPPPPGGPLNEPRTDVSAIPVPPGWAAGTQSLQQVIDAAPSGSVVNLSQTKSYAIGATVFVRKPLTLVCYGLTLSSTVHNDPAIAVLASDVRIEGLTGRGLGVPVGVKPPVISGHDFGAIQVGGYSVGSVQRFSLVNCDLSDAEYDVLYLSGGNDHKVLGNIIRRGGRTGLTGSGGTGWEMARNRFAENMTGDYDVGIHGGGVKLLHGSCFVHHNEFVGNYGRGFWSDTGFVDSELSDNRWHGNQFNGAFVESSHHIRVIRNVGWDNTKDPRAQVWGWGGSILFASSDHIDCFENVDADSGGGITVVSQQRTDDDAHVSISIHDNVVLDSGTYLSGWFMDWGGVLFDPASNNRGANNRYHGAAKFAWNGDKSLAQYNATPGEEGGRYLTDAEAAAIRAEYGIP